MKQELKKLKEELEKKIFNEILNFEKKTGLRVKEIKIVGGEYEITAVNIKAEL